MTNINKKAAEILVKCGYANKSFNETQGFINLHVEGVNKSLQTQVCDPFSDTLEGRRQADAIEDWLVQNKYDLWLSSQTAPESHGIKNHQWRLDRIKWCLEQLND